MHNASERPRRKRLSFESRCEIVAKVVEGGLTPDQVAGSTGVHRSTVYRLLARHRAGGWGALRERPPVPRRQPRRLDPQTEALILAARRRSRSGPIVLAAMLGRSASTIAKVLRRHGLSRLERPPRPEVVRYERERPGELLHLDTKRLCRFHQVGKRILSDGRVRSPGAGWHHLHVAVDDHSRLAYCEVLDGQDAASCCAFLARAAAWYAEQGIGIERVLTDNARAYHSHAWRDLCAELGIARRYTRPYTPRTNGKAEALIKTALREWAYRYAYPTSRHRTLALPGWVRWYNRRRPHSSLGGRPPISRVAQVRAQYT